MINWLLNLFRRKPNQEFLDAMRMIKTQNLIAADKKGKK